LTLLEVIISLAIFLFSIVALGHLVNVATDRALQAQLRQQAAFLCQSKLAEIAAGAEPLSSQAGTPFNEDADWLWTADCSEAEFPGLWRVTVSVSRQVGDELPLEVSLSQFVLDPTLRGSTADPAPTSMVEEETGSSTGSSSSSGSSQGSGSGGGSHGGPGGGGPGGGGPGGGGPGGGGPGGGQSGGGRPGGGKQ
jgi:type II secretory pathway pseudopilin PulG